MYIRNKFWYLCESPYLDTVVMICIILNILTMAMSYETSPYDYDAIVQ